MKMWGFREERIFGRGFRVNRLKIVWEIGGYKEDWKREVGFRM